MPANLKFNTKNFFSDLIFHPVHAATKEDCDKAWKATLLLGIFTLGVAHLLAGVYQLSCYLYDSCVVNKKEQEDLSSGEKRTQTIATQQGVVPEKKATLNTDKAQTTTGKSHTTAPAQLDETTVISLADSDEELKCAFIKSINDEMKRENRILSKDVKLLIYSILGRATVSLDGHIEREVPEKNISHIVIFRRDRGYIHPSSSISGKQVFNLTYVATLDEHMTKKYSFDAVDFDKLLRDITRPL